MQKRSYKDFYAIINVQGLSKEEVVLDASENRTESLTALTDSEYNRLMIRLKSLNQIPPGDKMRKKIISMARQMRWVLPGNRPDPKVDMARIDRWCLKSGKFKKPLMQHSVPELTLIVTVFEKVLSDYLEGVTNG